MDPEYHPLVIGKGGSVITKIRNDYGVQINLPKRGEPEDDTITIQGYEDKAIQAKEAIMAIVHQLVSALLILLLLIIIILSVGKLLLVNTIQHKHFFKQFIISKRRSSLVYQIKK